MKTSTFAVLFAASLAACSARAAHPGQGAGEPGASASVPAVPGEPFELRVGRSATLAGEGLRVSFQAVPSDSRCPAGVQCVWAGNALVHAVLSRDGKAFGAELNTNQEPTSVNYLEYKVALVSLAPNPTANEGAIPQSQYRATFVVTKPAP